MSNEEKTNKIITLALVVVITLTAITLIYVNLAEDTDEEENQDQQDGTDDEGSDDETEKAILFTLIYGDEKKEYNLSMLEDLEAYIGYGGIIQVGWLPKQVVLEGPYNYTGIRIATLLDEFTNLPDDYNITVTSDDDKTNEYNYSQIQGNVDLYNMTSGEIYGKGGVKMVLAYKNEGEHLDNTEGPLRIVFIDDGKITASNLWAKFVVSIEIIEE